MSAILSKTTIKAAQMQNGFGSLFEEDYLIRTLGRIAHDPEIAITELVANAWDAGASRVNIIIPTENENNLVVEDNGHGMTDKQFKDRWMKLAYDRVKHQGSKVEFPPGSMNNTRYAYGRNGVGRHGLLCFADTYNVSTKRDNIKNEYVVGTHSDENPFYIESTKQSSEEGHGTRLTVNVQRHLPNPDDLRQVITSRFLHDPQFQVYVNGESIKLDEYSGLVAEGHLLIAPDLEVEILIFDSPNSGVSTLYQGVAFWVNNRLIGSPSWIVGNRAILDGRSRYAKTYSVVVKAGEQWVKFAEPDWSRLITKPEVTALYKAVCEFCDDAFKDIAKNYIDESSKDALMKNREEYKGLSTLSRIEVAEFTSELVKNQPSIHPESLSLAVKALINLEKSRSGTALLEKLTLLDDSDIEGLDRLLSQWTVRDALTVLDEIDNRLAVIAAIEKLSIDPSTDELHTLHPLVTQSRWLFGPEYDSHEYASNVTLQSLAKQLFGKVAIKDTFRNYRQRPDIVVLADKTLSIVGTEAYGVSDTTLIQLQSILIIELKKGHSQIGRDEMNQADGYVQDLISSNLIDGQPLIKAFVVGHKVDSQTATIKEIKTNGNLRGIVTATTYGQLTRTANQRLLSLRKKLPDRYEEATGNELMAQVMETASQVNMPNS